MKRQSAFQGKIGSEKKKVLSEGLIKHGGSTQNAKIREKINISYRKECNFIRIVILYYIE